MKTKTFLFSLIISANLSFGQQTKQMVLYYDFTKTQIKQTYSVLVSNPAKMHGYFKEFYRNTVVKMEGNMTNGNATGKWIYRWEHNGEISKIENYNNETDLHGSYKEWSGYNNPKLSVDGNYNAGKKQGEWKYFYSGETILRKVEFYENGLKSGTWKNYSLKGKLESVVDYANDEMIRMEAYHNTNDNKHFIATYKDDKKSGEYLEWYENGNLKLKENYLNDAKSGLCSEYYEDGNKKHDIVYPKGECTFWNEKQEVEFKGECDYGRKFGNFKMVKDGKIV